MSRSNEVVKRFGVGAAEHVGDLVGQLCARGTEMEGIGTAER